MTTASCADDKAANWALLNPWAWVGVNDCNSPMVKPLTAAVVMEERRGANPASKAAIDRAPTCAADKAPICLRVSPAACDAVSSDRSFAPMPATAPRLSAAICAAVKAEKAVVEKALIWLAVRAAACVKVKTAMSAGVSLAMVEADRAAMRAGDLPIKMDTMTDPQNLIAYVSERGPGRPYKKRFRESG